MIDGKKKSTVFNCCILLLFLLNSDVDFVGANYVSCFSRIPSWELFCSKAEMKYSK